MTKYNLLDVIPVLDNLSILDVLNYPFTKAINLAADDDMDTPSGEYTLSFTGAHMHLVLSHVDNANIRIYLTIGSIHHMLQLLSTVKAYIETNGTIEPAWLREFCVQVYSTIHQ